MGCDPDRCTECGDAYCTRHSAAVRESESSLNPGFPPELAITAPVILLGLDPGFASFGWAVMQIARPGTLGLLSAGVIRTEKSAKKHAVLASEDNHARSREIASELRKLVILTRPRAFCAESQSWPRNAGAAAKVAMAWGAISTVSMYEGLALLQASPQAIKKKLCGVRDAAKEDVEKVVRAVFGPGACDHALKNVPKSLREHAYDAMAAAITCADAEVVRMLLR